MGAGGIGQSGILRGQLSLGMREAYRYVYYVRPQDKVAALHFG